MWKKPPVSGSSMTWNSTLMKEVTRQSGLRWQKDGGNSNNHALKLRWAEKHPRTCWSLVQMSYNSNITHRIPPLPANNSNLRLQLARAHGNWANKKRKLFKRETPCCRALHSNLKSCTRKMNQKLFRVKKKQMSHILQQTHCLTYNISVTKISDQKTINMKIVWMLCTDFKLHIKFTADFLQTWFSLKDPLKMFTDFSGTAAPNWTNDLKKN